MHLFTVQSLEVVSILKRDTLYYADYDKSYWVNQEDDIQRSNFKFAYMWLMDQYNQRKKHDYSCAPVWWYTSLKELKRQMRYVPTTDVILQAEVPDKIVLLYDADQWEEGPFSTYHLGWQGHFMHSKMDWGKDNDRFEQLFDKLYDIYRANPEVAIATWPEIFNIRKSDGTQRLHAITPYIDLTWCEPKVPETGSTSYTEM